MLKKGLLLLSCLIIVPRIVFALATPTAPTDERIYKNIEILIAAKLVKPTITGQRPYAMSNVCKMVAKAVEVRKSWDETNEERVHYIDSVLNEMKGSCVDELEPANFVLHPFKQAKAENVYIKDDMEAIYPNNGLGSINAILFPMESYREGRHFSPGYQTFIETESYVQLSKYFLVYVKPSFRLSENPQAFIQNLYAKFEVANIELEVGRDSLLFGVGQYGPLLLSSNPRPLDMVKLTNPAPVILPWIFKYLGPSRMTLFVANLGPEQNLKYPYLAGYKLDIMPLGLWELGFSHTVMMGGQGSPSLSPWEAIGEFIGFRVAGTDPDSTNKSNHIMEADTALTIPSLRYTRFYFAINNEDKRDTIERFFVEATAYLGGVYIPRLTNTGNADLRLEYYHTSPLNYRHGMYQYGYTLNRYILGSALGPDADGIHLEYHQDLFNDIRYDLTGMFDWERRGSDIYTTTTEADGTYGDIIKTKGQPSEHRLRFGVKHRFPVSNYLLLESKIAYEYVINKNYEKYRNGNDLLFSFAFTYDFDRFTRYKSH